MPEFRTDDGVRLRYVERGVGRLPVFYLHWVGGDTGTWTPLWDALHGPALRHVALDFRAHGGSQRMPSTFTNERLAHDVLQLAGVLGIQRFAVVAHSFAGRVALRLALLAPARVAGLVLIGAAGSGEVLLERKKVDAMLRRADDVTFVRRLFKPCFADWPRAEIDRWVANFANTPAWARKEFCEIGLWSQEQNENSSIEAPALLIAGEHDPIYGPNYQRTVVLPRLPGARLVTIKCGHGLVVERPAEIATHCENFLSRL